MFARVTPYKMKAGTRDEATALLHSMKDRIMALPGMVHFVNVANEDGSGYVVSVIESEELSNANMAEVKEIWGAFSDHLEAMPVPEGYDVMANWSA